MEKRAKELVNPSDDEEQGIDRLSALPDSTLCHILSFLPTTKDTVATSILARSWRYVWTEIPFLSFNFAVLDLGMNGKTDCSNSNCTVRKCKNWVGNIRGRQGIFCARRGYYDVLSSVMLLHKVKELDRFRVRYSVYDLTDSQLISCITEAIARGAEDVIIYCECKGVRGVKSLVIVCECKRVNGVKNCGIDWECKGEHWVTSARRKRRNFGNKLPLSVFCCETLVCLRLTGCFLYIPPGVEISLMSLTKLYLADNGYDEVDTLPRLISGCPVLEEIVLFQCFHQNFFGEVKYPPTLIKAKIYFDSDEVWWPATLNSVYTVKSLILYCIYGDFGDINFKFIKNRLTNLIRLDFTVLEWQLLFKILEIADILKDLVVSVEDADCGWFKPPPAPNCVISHLETVEIVGLDTEPTTFHLVSYLLKNARVLKKMTICLPKPDIRIAELQDKISSLDWGSTECKLVFKHN